MVRSFDISGSGSGLSDRSGLGGGLDVGDLCGLEVFGGGNRVLPRDLDLVREEMGLSGFGVTGNVPGTSLDDPPLIGRSGREV